MERALKSLLIALSLLLLSSPAFASTILLNSPSWNGVTAVNQWGTDSTPTYGQTVTVPTNGDRVLSSFTFQIFGGPPSIAFNAYVQAWDGAETTGAPLFTSSGNTLTPAGASPYTFNPNLSLTPGATYLLYFSVLGVANANLNNFDYGATTADTYVGGSFFFTNLGFGNPAGHAVSELNNANATATPWFNGGACCGISDLAFQAVFEGPQTAPVPEPATMALLGTGISALVARRRRAKK